MNDPIMTILKEWGSTGASIVVVILFLRYLDKVQTASTASLTRMAEAIDNLAKRIEHCPTREENRKGKQ